MEAVLTKSTLADASLLAASWLARVRPIVIQTLFMRIHGQSPSAEEIAAYTGRLRTILAEGGKIQLVQIHTIARRPAESYAAPLENAEVDAIALAYYRFERIIEDIAAYGVQIFLSNEGGQDRDKAIRSVETNFLPGNTIELAYRTARPMS